MRVNYTGCALCDSTWGDCWEEVEGERRFFCCATCATGFRRLVERVKAETGWPRIEALEIEGDRRGRTCVATFERDRLRCHVALNAEGELREFIRLP